MDITRQVALPPGARGIQRAAPPRRLRGPLYKHGGIEVTPEWLVINGFHYPVIELHNLRTARGPHHPLTVRAMVISMVALLGLVATVGLAQEPVDVGGGTYLAMGAAFILPFVFAAVGERLYPRAWELWGDYYGVEVRLFVASTEHQYGQVTRALVRAQEIARLGAAAEMRDLDPWLTRQRMVVRH